MDSHAKTGARRGAKAVISSTSKVLLVREQHSDGQMFWTLPGGGVRPHESLVDGIRREMREELCCDPVINGTVGEFWYAHRSSSEELSRYTVFSCALVSFARPVRTENILEARWVTPGRLPAKTIPQVRALIQNLDHESDT